jgi:hypothetical protein
MPRYSEERKEAVLAKRLPAHAVLCSLMPDARFNRMTPHEDLRARFAHALWLTAVEGAHPTNSPTAATRSTRVVLSGVDPSHRQWTPQ